MKREIPLIQPSNCDKLIVLLQHWDLSKVEIGLVRFPAPPAESAGKIYVGCVETDPLILLIRSGELVVHEFGTKGHLLWRVAKNGSALLEALVIAARCLRMQGDGTIDFRDSKAAWPFALDCAAAAGGDDYLDFYKMQLGAS